MLRCIRRNPEVTNTQRSPLRACRSYGPLVRTVQLIMPHARATPCMHATPQLDRLIAIEIRSRIITITRIPPKTRITNECTHLAHLTRQPPACTPAASIDFAIELLRTCLCSHRYRRQHGEHGAQLQHTHACDPLIILLRVGQTQIKSIMYKLCDDHKS